MNKNGKVISIINMKDGVGKTALSVGISSFLSEKEGEKVLLINSDPQFDVTQAFMGPEDYLKSEKTISKLFKPQTELHQSFVTPKREELVTKINKSLDILMGDLNLVLANEGSDSDLIRRLKRFIIENNLRNYYNYVIIDCPPTSTLYTDSALVSSDYYLILNRINRYSNIGISPLNRAIGGLIDQEDLELRCLGLACTMVRNHLSGRQEEVKAELESSKAIENVYVLKSSISLVNDMQVGRQEPITARYAKSNEDISDVVDGLQALLSKNSSKEGVIIDG